MTHEHPGGGEAAIARTVAESMAYNAERRTTSYRLQSNPDLVVRLGDTAEASNVAENLFDKRDRVAIDIAIVSPYALPPVESPPYDYGN